MAQSFQKRLLRNSRGQFVIEAVLLMTLSIGLLIWGTKQLQEKKWLSAMISGPWQKAAGMIEAGTWDDPKTASAKHPNKLDRHRTPYPRL